MIEKMRLVMTKEHNLKQYKFYKRILEMLKTCVINSRTKELYEFAQQKVDTCLGNIISRVER
jgi:hypothetical protein